jgi:ATP-dependent DNA helicase RecG
MAGMSRRVDDLKKLLEKPEGERLECKEAKSSFSFDKLLKYCAAIANEGGGHVILGVTDRLPRRIVGTAAFPELHRVVAQLTERLRYVKVEAEEYRTPEGRVVVFHVPGRPRGIPIELDGAYYMRAGDDVRPMTPDRLRQILLEASTDFSAEVCPGADMEDLDPISIELFRAMWLRRTGNELLRQIPANQLLTDAELVTQDGITNAALILLGTRSALGRLIPQAEVVFEYRLTDASVPAQQRQEFRQGFLATLDELWKLVNLRNEIISIPYGLFRLEVPVFNEAVVREAILNAVTHRDYRLPGSVLIRQYPRRLEIISPGGFPAGINERNILWRQSPRNRRLAEACQRCGLVERSGQGADQMFGYSIKEGKPWPDYSRTDDHQVWLTLRGDIENPELALVLARIGHEELGSYSVEDLIILDLIEREEPIWEELKPRIPVLVRKGVIERVGRGRGARYVLSQRLYALLGRRGAYMRRRGLDRDTNKALLLEHIRKAGAEGARFADMMEVLPNLSRGQIKTLLQELKSQGKVFVRGTTRGARWVACTNAPNANSTNLPAS